jgi:hypothetical protein
MKIYEDVLPPALLNKCIEELRSSQDSHVWGASNLYWEEILKVGIVGNTSIRHLPEELSLEVHQALGKYFSKIGNEFMYQYYIWNKMAGVSNHHDGKYSEGATLYLNETWDPNWGGIFVWKDKGEKKEYKLNALCPKQNTLVVNNEKETHLVTPVSPISPYVRITIQIWHLAID